jgi:dipeptidyl-peptidase 4
MKKIILVINVILLNFAFAQELTNEKIWNSNEFRMKYISGFKSMKDGVHFTKLSQNKDSLCISKHKFTDYKGNGETILNLSNYSKIIPTHSIDGYQFNNSEDKIIITTSSKSIYRRSYTAIHYLYDLNTHTLETLSEKYSPQTQVEYSPNGKLISFIYNNNIYIKNLQTKAIVQITNDGFPNKIINGTTDWVYEEEFAITKGYYWSPNSENIAFLKFDESKVKEVNMSIYGTLYPQQEKFKYPKAGEDNSLVTLNIHDLGINETKQIQLQDYEYIPRFRWAVKENTLIALTLNRHQNHLKIHHIKKDNEQYLSKVFYSEQSKTYIEIDDNLEIMSDNSLLLTSEKSGFKHLYSLDFHGNISQITNGNWDVIDFYGIDEKKNLLFYTSSETGTINKSIYQVKINGKGKKIISSKEGYSEADFSKGMKYFRKTYSTANTPNHYTLCNSNGKELFVIEDNKKLKYSIEKYNLSDKYFFKLKGKEDSLNASIIKPKNFDPLKKYPVYLHVYGGPGSNTVLNRFKGSEYLYHQLLANKGYIIISIDPRGTMYRGVRFKKSTYLQLGKLELEDITEAVKNFAKNNEFVDTNRIGIQGWSFGGYLTSLAMTKGNNLFKMGIAIAPVTNWEFYDNIYTERFMRTPDENKAGYSENSPINFAENLEGKYLIVHGSADDNVHLQNTLEMIEALVQANKKFESFIYPNKNHGIYGGNTRNHLFNMMLNFTINNL